MSLQYHLDTNILVWGVRGNDTWQRIKASCDPLMVEPRPLISIVTHGELFSLAQRLNWAEVKNNQMHFLLSYFPTLDINRPDILVAYAKIDHFSHTMGVTMGKNDLWIAATAHVENALLVTTDADFDHLNEVFLTVQRIKPVTGGAS